MGRTHELSRPRRSYRRAGLRARHFTGDGALVTFLATIALVAALTSPSEHVRERAVRPLIVREAREHGLSSRLLTKVAFRESSFRFRLRGDHGKAVGLFQVHGDAIPGRRYTRAELQRPDVNAHVACLRLLLARHRCGGAPRHYAANFNGMPCGVDVYRLASEGHP